MAQRGVLDQRDVEIAESWAAKRAASKSSKPAVVRARSSGNVDRDLEKRAVRRPHAKVVFSHRAAGGQIRHAEQVGPIRSAQAYARLLDTRIHGERGAARQRCYVQELPSFDELLAQRLQKAHAIQRQGLNQAQRENVGHIKSGRALLSARVQGILGQRLQNHARTSGNSAGYRAGVINTFGKRIASLDAEAHPEIILADARL